MGNRVMVLLAGSTSFLRASIRLVIEGRPRFQVVGEAFSPPIAIAIARQKKPQIVLLDYRHSGRVFFDAIQRITQENGGACLLVGTAEQGSIVAERARELGVGAFLMENDDPRNLIGQLEQICG